jgi:GNAT superfamily N-acetyltransferase
LHDAALERLGAYGVQQVQLGAGALNYFWPGVPIDLPGAWAFFQALGWTEVARSFDLTRSLDDYLTPAWVWEKWRGLGLDFVTADKAGLEKEAINFVSVEYPGWVFYFVQAIGEGRARDVILARRNSSAEILGACLVENPVQRWAQRLRQPVGAPGCILTAQAVRDRGIGMALVALATETLQARGCRTSFIGWTWLVDWYGKLGYKTWQEYIMSRMDLNERAW